MEFDSRTPWKQALLPVASLFVICALLQVFEPQSAHWFAYNRAAIGAGEYWRLLTGSLLHLGWGHLLLNLAGMLLAVLLFPALRSGRLRYLAFLIGLMTVGAGLYLGSPDIQWYLGLSGVLHTLFVAACVVEWRAAPRWDVGLYGALLATKLAYEQWVGALPGSVQATGGPVVVDAHLYGAVGGVLAALIAAAGVARRTTPSERAVR